MASAVSYDDALDQGYREDLGNVIGCFCGVIPVIAMIASVVYLIGGHPRKAFQSIAVSVASICVFLVLTFGLNFLYYTKGSPLSVVFIIIYLIGWVFFPLLTLSFLRTLYYPNHLKSVLIQL